MGRVKPLHELPPGEKLVYSIHLDARLMSSGSLIVNCDCGRTFKFQGGDDFDHLVMPLSFGDVLSAHFKSEHDCPTPMTASFQEVIFEAVIKQLRRKAKGDESSPEFFVG